MQHHKATITKTTKVRPFHAQCVCGTAGDFLTKDNASAYLSGHHANLGGIATGEIIDHSDKLEAEPVLPSTHVAGVGCMPASHAALGADEPVEKSPTPPESRKGVDLRGEQQGQTVVETTTAKQPPPPPDPPDTAKKKKE